MAFHLNVFIIYGDFESVRPILTKMCDGNQSIEWLRRLQSIGSEDFKLLPASTPQLNVQTEHECLFVCL